MYNFYWPRNVPTERKLQFALFLPRICSYGTAYGFRIKVYHFFLKRFYNSPDCPNVPLGHMLGRKKYAIFFIVLFLPGFVPMEQLMDLLTK